MNSSVKIIGFDLDQTLYPKSPEIDEAIQEYIYTRISAQHGCSIDESRKMFYLHYPASSGSKTLELLGVPNARDVVQEALERADIARFLQPSPQIVQLLNDIRTKYGSVSLLTGSDRPIAEKKLRALHIPLELFDLTLFGTPSKSTGEAYVEWLNYFKQKNKELQPNQFLYIGDRYSSDVEAPQKLGIQTWLVNNPPGKYPGIQTYSDLLSIRADLL
ncbi:MAG: HAD family hydrolase [archaeon]